METRSDKFFRYVERACDAYVVLFIGLVYVALFVK